MAITRVSNTCRKKCVHRDFRYEYYLRGRKTARKSKPPQGITLKKRKSDQISSSSSCSKKSEVYSCLKVFKKVQRSRDVIPGSGSVDDYQGLNVISQGSYGVVYRARDNTTGEIVAIKEEFDGLSPSSLTEIEILKSLHPHPSIIDFKKVVVDDFDGVYIVMEYLENDLRRYMGSRTNHFTMKEVKLLMKQLIGGVKFLHDNHVMHRDLKPSNILINSRGELKICDFGLSCSFPSASGTYSPRVGTLWYKAPELLLGDTSYSCAVDMWSVGCIMGELVLKEALFQGRSDMDQLDKIFEVVGTPNAKFVQPRDNLIRSKLCFSRVAMMKELGFDLLSRLLTCDPANRITADSALNHAWFKEY
ncbi:hypothetical protein ACS0TY_021160 [Phlomoides rotata]